MEWLRNITAACYTSFAGFPPVAFLEVLSALLGRFRRPLADTPTPLAAQNHARPATDVKSAQLELPPQCTTRRCHAFSNAHAVKSQQPLIGSPADVRVASSRHRLSPLLTADLCFAGAYSARCVFTLTSSVSSSAAPRASLPLPLRRCHPLPPSPHRYRIRCSRGPRRTPPRPRIPIRPGNLRRRSRRPRPRCRDLRPRRHWMQGRRLEARPQG